MQGQVLAAAAGECAPAQLRPNGSIICSYGTSHHVLPHPPGLMAVSGPTAHMVQLTGTWMPGHLVRLMTGLPSACISCLTTLPGIEHRSATAMPAGNAGSAFIFIYLFI